MDMIRLAKAFAVAAHSATGQVRKYTAEPYWKHPEAVVQILLKAGADEATICAAWLHDVVEDTLVPLAIIERLFGFEIASLVNDVTDVSKPEDGNRATRKAIDRQHLAKASPRAKTIKLADLIDNTRSIAARDPEFAKVYLVEKAQLLGVLHGGSSALWALAYTTLTDAARDLGVELPDVLA